MSEPSVSPERARELIDGFRGKRVAVIGDLMLDRYIWGRATRISQEAPVPVVPIQRETTSPGGAANVLRNLAALGAGAIAYGVVGADASGNELCRLLAENDIDISQVTRDPGRMTTEKIRIIADHQQIVRIDRERIEPIPEWKARDIHTMLRERACNSGIHAIIIEDYAKGLLNEAVVAALAAVGSECEIPVALDPHPATRMHVQGLTLLTPNRAEAFAMTGIYPQEPVMPLEADEALLQVVDALHERWAPKQLLITLGADGMALFPGKNHPVHIPTRAEEVYDVSGAGDTVVATYVLGLAAGATSFEAAVLANHAAGLVVKKVGTATVTPEELAASFHDES